MIKKIGITILTLCLLAGVLYGGAFLIYQSRVKQLKLSHPDLKTVADGHYTGEFNAILVQSTVKVNVKNQQIVNIDLVEHVYDRGKQGESIIEKVLKEQSTDVDAVSGATNSSNVILKSIENALEKGVE